MYFVSKSIWLDGTASAVSVYLRGIDMHYSSPTSATPAPTTTAWTVGKTASASYCPMTASTTVGASTFTTVFKPDGGLSSTIGEGWCFGPYTGVFAKNTMSIVLNYVATTVNAQAGRVFFRIWKASDVSGSNSSLVTPTARSTQAQIIVDGGTTRLSASFIMTSSLFMNNEYLFLETAFGVTTAGGANGCDVVFRQGSGSVFTTGPFENNTFVILSDDDNPGYVN